MRTTARLAAGLALAGSLGTPALAANLIFNPSFETAMLGGLPTNWTLTGAPGDLFKWNSPIWGPGCLPGGTPDGQGNCPVDPLGCVPDAMPVNGCNYVSVQTGDDVPGVYYVHQVVSGLTPGSEYEFRGFFGGGSNSSINHGDACTIFMRVRDGSGPTTGTLLAQANKYVQNHNAGFGWQEATRYFKATGTTVTIVCGLDSSFQYGARAVHVDLLSLDLATLNCPTQHEATAVTANGSVDQGSDVVGVQITGSGLENVTGVKLVSTHLHTAPVELDGTITAQPGTTLTADFDTATGPGGVMPVGKYDVVVELAGCNPRVIPLGLEITCPLGVLNFSTINADRGLSGDPSHTIGITGSANLEANVGLITEVRLRKTRSPNGTMSQDIIGTNIRAAGQGPGNEILVDFDLSSVEAGRWGIQVQVNHPCGSSFVDVVDGFTDAFLVYLPFNTGLDAIGNVKAVWNGSFEEGYATDGGLPQCQRAVPGTQPVNPKAMHWDMNPVISFTGGHKRDGEVLWPGCSGSIPAGGTGDHYDGIDIHAPVGVGANDVRLFQTIDIGPRLDGNDQLIEPLNIRAEIAANGGGLGSTNTAFINLIDGTESARAQEFSATIPEALGTFALIGDASYNAVVPAGTTWQTLNPALLTVELAMTTTGAGWTDLPPEHEDYDWLRFHAFWVDNVRTGGFIPPACAGSDPVFDADQDGDVDHEDFGALQECLTGVGGGIPASPPYCVCVDLHGGSGGGDGDITQADINAFDACASGPGVAADAACDD